jgi:hypothetical protein
MFSALRNVACVFVDIQKPRGPEMVSFHLREPGLGIIKPANRLGGRIIATVRQATRAVHLDKATRGVVRGTPCTRALRAFRPLGRTCSELRFEQIMVDKI